MHFFSIHTIYCSANKLCRPPRRCFTTLVLFISFISIISIGIDSGGGGDGGNKSIVIIIILIVFVVVIIGIVTFFLCAVYACQHCCIALTHLVGHIQYYTFTVHVRCRCFWRESAHASIHVVFVTNYNRDLFRWMQEFVGLCFALSLSFALLQYSSIKKISCISLRSITISCWSFLELYHSVSNIIRCNGNSNSNGSDGEWSSLPSRNCTQFREGIH